MGIELLTLALSFTLIVLASREIGKGGARLGLPMVSGFIVTGALAGPYLLGFVSQESTRNFFIVDAVALPFIAFLAGAELHLSEIRKRLRTIITILAGIIIVVFAASFAALMLFADSIPFMADRNAMHKIGVAILGATILVAKSPSTLVAVVKELKARGPFVQTVLGVTVLMDSVVIIFFALNSSIADVLFQGTGFNALLVFGPIVEITIDIALGFILAMLLAAVLSLSLPPWLKTILIPFFGYVVSSANYFIPEFQLGALHLQLFSEPLLICVIAGARLSNFSKHGVEFEKFLADATPLIFLLFFTSLGLSINLEFLMSTWHIALLLVAVRGIGMISGAFLGSSLAGGEPQHNRYLGTAFITQAGISLSLTRAVELAYPSWGSEFATVFIAVIVLNTLLGPSFTKFGILSVGEGKVKAAPTERRGSRRALIFGIEDQSRALYRQLQAHDWEVTLVDLETHRVKMLAESEEEPKLLKVIDVDSLRNLGAHVAESLILMMDDDTNFKIAEIAYEYFGGVDVVVRVTRSVESPRFHELGAMVVEPGSAMIALLDHCVRSPVAASLLLGKEKDKDIVEITVSNSGVHGLALRDLHFADETLVLAIRRKGNLLFSHGYTRLRLGDDVTVAGSLDALKDVRMRLVA